MRGEGDADIRNIVANRTCRQEVFGAGPYPPQTFLVVGALARHGMLVEIEVTAIAANSLDRGRCWPRGR